MRVTRKESQPRLSLLHLLRQRGKKRAGENQEGSSLFLSLRDERSSQGYLFLSDSFFTREFGKTEVMSPGKLSNVKKGRITAAARHHRKKVPRRNLLDGWVKKKRRWADVSKTYGCFASFSFPFFCSIYIL